MADFDVHRLSQIRRINVVGTPGSGKTTFGRRLAEVLGLPFVEMDQVYWGRDWAEPTDEVFFPELERITAGPSWVLDGNYSRTFREMASCRVSRLARPVVSPAPSIA